MPRPQRPPASCSNLWLADFSYVSEFASLINAFPAAQRPALLRAALHGLVYRCTPDGYSTSACYMYLFRCLKDISGSLPDLHTLWHTENATVNRCLDAFAHAQGRAEVVLALCNLIAILLPTSRQNSRLLRFRTNEEEER